jgi:hypothetical protein
VKTYYLFAALLLALFALLLAFYFILSCCQSGKEALPLHVNFVIGVCTHGNISSELFAIQNGVKFFRTDITNTKEQVNLLSYEHSFGADYLGILDYATLPGGIGNKNWSLLEWNQSVEKAVESYPWIHTWEIWNEPYLPMFQTGYMNGSAYNYYILIKSTAKIIREHEPNATIVCFGGAPLGDINIFNWYTKVWDYGAYKYCDAISVHIYNPSPSLLSDSEIAAINQYLSAYEQLTSKPIWVTEIGMPSSSKIPGYSTLLQKEFMVQSFDMLNNVSYVKRVYWYDLWGLSNGLLSNNFGLLNLTNPKLEPSPAWYIFLAYQNRSLQQLNT